MTFDKKSLDRLLSLDDEMLRSVLTRLLAEYGVDPSAVPLRNMDMGRLRDALRGATDEDIARFMQLMQASGKANGGRG